jgi:hypothetical protein
MSIYPGLATLGEVGEGEVAQLVQGEPAGLAGEEPRRLAVGQAPADAGSRSPAAGVWGEAGCSQARKSGLAPAVPDEAREQPGGPRGEVDPFRRSL